MASIADKTKIQSEPVSELDANSTAILELIRETQVGLADVEAGRVIPHEEVRELLHKRYAG